jgi:hypothetical protein
MGSEMGRDVAASTVVTMGVILWRDGGRGTAVKGNDDDEWSSDGVVLCLGRMQNVDVVEWWGE